MRFLRICALLLLFLATLPVLVEAEDRLDQRDSLVGRVSLVDGEAKVRFKGEEEWNDAAGNYPITAGDSLYVEDNSRLEMELYLVYVRLSENTALETVSLAPYRYKFKLTVGTASFTLLEDMKEMEVYTPLATVRLKRAGSYRVNVLPSGDTEVITREGEAEVVGALDTPFKVKSGRLALLRADDPTDIEISSSLLTDYWDGWNDERDELLRVDDQTASYISSGNSYSYGLSDLNRYGSWLDNTPWGPVWTPSGVSAGWAPYRQGFWIQRRWGWTWISFEPWGWLPYHYGRWAFFTDIGRWVWIPYQIDSFWYPALVYWYSVRHDNRNYVCWRPRPHTGTTSVPQPSEPVITKQGGKGGITYPGGSPRPRIDDLGDGVTILDVDSFVAGRPPQSERPRDIIVKVNEAEPTINVPAVPKQSRPRVAPPDLPKEVISRPVVTPTSRPVTTGARPYRIDDKLRPVPETVQRPAKPRKTEIELTPSEGVIRRNPPPAPKRVEVRPVEQPTVKERPKGYERAPERPARVDRPTIDRPAKIEAPKSIEPAPRRKRD